MNKRINKKIPLYDIKLNREAIGNANEVLKSGWLSPGKFTHKFEQAISNHFDKDATVGTVHPSLAA